MQETTCRTIGVGLPADIRDEISRMMPEGGVAFSEDRARLGDLAPAEAAAIFLLDARNGALTEAERFIAATAPRHTVIVIAQDPESAAQLLAAGAADFITPPLDMRLIHHRLKIAQTRQEHLHRVRQLDQLIEEESGRKAKDSAELSRVLIPLLAKLIESYDPNLGAHHVRVMSLTEITAKFLFFHPEADVLTPDLIESISLASVLHDLGNAYLDTDTLLKSGSLTESDIQKIRSHTLEGERILLNIAETVSMPGVRQFLMVAAGICRNHHEHFDGSGYPAGLRGDKIPLSARIVSVVDTYDSLRLDRPYRDAWSHDRALAFIRDNAGTKYDPFVVEAFSLIDRTQLDSGRMIR